MHRRGTEEFRIWVVAAALYAVVLHAMAMAVMGGSIAIGPGAMVAQHSVHAEDAKPGGGHASQDHVPCCVLCGTAGCAGAFDRPLPGAANVLARAVGPTRTVVAHRRRVDGEPRQARGPPCLA